MKNNKGQALVEFILVLPVFLLLIISLIDFGNIILKKYELENDLNVISDMYENDERAKINDYVNDKDIKITYSESNNLITINLNRNINVISPMVNVILGKNYQINVNRSIYINE